MARMNPTLSATEFQAQRKSDRLSRRLAPQRAQPLGRCSLWGHIGGLSGSDFPDFQGCSQKAIFAVQASKGSGQSAGPVCLYNLARSDKWIHCGVGARVGLTIMLVFD